VGRPVYGKNGDREIAGRAAEYKPLLPLAMASSPLGYTHSSPKKISKHSTQIWSSPSLLLPTLLMYKEIISSRILAKGHPTSIVNLETVLATVNTHSSPNKFSKHTESSSSCFADA
jgi:hypothetical protein